MDSWQELLDERLSEAVAALGAVPGVRGLVVGGSVGRQEPWPLSDIDLLPIVVEGAGPEEELERRHARLIDWWAASGRAQTLDVGRLRFTDREVEAAVRGGAAFAVERMPDLRWFHGMDKAYGGRGAADPDGLAETFARWAAALRFDPQVVVARVREWSRQAREARDRAAEAYGRDDPARATIEMRQSGRALRLVLLEGWGERLGSMGREWTRFERMVARHGGSDLAVRLAALCDALPSEALAHARVAPAWLRARVDLAYRGRLSVGEEVTEAESARDQLAAFAVHVTRRQPGPWGAWAGVPDPALPDKLAELDRLIAEICAPHHPTLRGSSISCRNRQA